MASLHRKRRHRLSRAAAKQRDALIEKYGRFCCHCGKPIREDLAPNDPDRMTIEHLLPISKGGASDFENLRLACYPCNQAHGARTAREKAAAPGPFTGTPGPVSAQIADDGTITLILVDYTPRRAKRRQPEQPP